MRINEINFMIEQRNIEKRGITKRAESPVINSVGQRPIVRNDHSAQPCKGVINWMSGLQPVERDGAIFTGRCPVLLNTRLAALKCSCAASTDGLAQTRQTIK